MHQVENTMGNYDTWKSTEPKDLDEAPRKSPEEQELDAREEASPKVGDTLQAEIPGFGETEVTVEEIDEDGVIWVSTRDGEEWELGGGKS